MTPLCSTYFNVIGDEIDWDDIVLMFAGAGADWDGAAFFPAAATGGRAARQSDRAAAIARARGAARRRIGWCSTKATSSTAADDN